MCSIDWQMLLEYLRVLLSWPPMVAVIAGVFFFRFRSAIESLLNRVVEGRLFGQEFKASPLQQEAAPGVSENRLELAVDPRATVGSGDPLPVELVGDPHAEEAMEWVRGHPAETLAEYKRLLKSYDCERLFNRIYGTQIALLEFLASRTPSTVTLAEIAPFHREHQRRAGSTDYQLDRFVAFLVDFAVVSVEGPQDAREYTISDAGVVFLSYIRANFPTAWNVRGL